MNRAWKSRRIVRLLRILTGSAILMVMATLLMVGWTWSRVRAERGDATVPTTELMAQTEHSLARGWQQLLLFGGSGSLLFLWLARTISNGVQDQFNALERARAEAEEEHRKSQQLAAEQQAAAARLAETSSLLEVMWQNCPDAIYFKDRESRFVHYSKSCLGRFHLQPEENLKGKSPAAIFPAEYARQTRLDEQEIMLTGQPLIGKMEKEVHPNGQVTWALTSKMPWRDNAGQILGTFGVSVDITALKSAEAELAAAHRDLQESELRFRSLSATAPIGISLDDATGAALYFNPYWLDIAGLTLEQCLGDGWQRALHPDDAEAMLTARKSAHRRGWGFTYDYRIRRPSGEIRWVHSCAVAVRSQSGGITGFVGTTEDITERRKSEESLRLQEAALRSAANVVVITNRAGDIVWVNPAFSRVTGYSSEEVLGKNPSILRLGQAPSTYPPDYFQQLWRTIESGSVWHGEFHNRRKDGSPLIEEATITPVRNHEGEITHFIAVKQDITRRKEAERERALLEVQLRHAQKLESIGQLAAGIAHEINTPTQFVGDNLRFVKESLPQLQDVLSLPAQFLQAAREHRLTPELLDRAEATLAAADLEYVSAEIPRAIEESIQGVGRVSRIVRAMKDFSHPGSEEKTLVDLNKAIESTLTVARNEWKYVADLVTDFDPDLPKVSCLPGEFNQVILNLVVNAAHAIGDALKQKDPTGKGTITARTRHDGDWVEVRLSDTGTGIPESARSRIFDPFFTTKAVGRGTGQGLAIARSVIVDKHGGTISFETESGVGTTFVVRLPLHPQPTGERAGS